MAMVYVKLHGENVLIGTRFFCELDFVKKEWTPRIPSENEIKRNCHKCVYEVGCTDNPVGCKRYKRDAPDGGYYG